MHTIVSAGSRLALFGAMAFVGLGCFPRTDAEPGSSGTEVNASSNTDVQVVSAKADGTIQWAVGSLTGFDAKKCIYSDRQPHTTSGEFTSRARADCTDALIEKLGPTIARYVEPSASIRETPDLVHSSFRHWCGQLEVVVAVKAAAWDAPAFRGIGFFATATPLNEPQPPMFYDKTDRRLVRIGEATLKNEGHQRAYLYRFAGAGPCEPNGSGDNPGGLVELKPFVTFDGGFERWEAVQANHRIGYRQSWSRRADLLD